MVRLIYKGSLKELTGRENEEIDAKKLKDIVKYVKKTYGADAEQAVKQALITVDKLRCYEPSTVLPPDCTVEFYPFCGGG